jgi:hypothetical protein
MSCLKDLSQHGAVGDRSSEGVGAALSIGARRGDALLWRRLSKAP